MTFSENMIARKFVDGDAASEAIYSACESYRYELTRVWDCNGPRILFIMLNPSTATEYKNDPTVARCEGRARYLHFGSYKVCNIFALRSTNPKELYKSDFPIGKDNNEAIKKGCVWADKIVCAWGNHGELHDRGRAVENLIRGIVQNVFHLGLTKRNMPKHPLYIPHSQPLVCWI